MYTVTYEKLVRVESIDTEHDPILSIPMEQFDEKSIATTLFLHRFTENQRRIVNSILPTIRKMLLSDEPTATDTQVPYFEIVQGREILVRFTAEGSTTSVAYRIYVTDFLDEEFRVKRFNASREAYFNTGIYFFAGFGISMCVGLCTGFLTGRRLFR